MKLAAETVTTANSFETPRLITSDATSAGAQLPRTHVTVAELKLKWTSARILGASPTFYRQNKALRAAKDQI
jgi:hypothetical protein